MQQNEAYVESKQSRKIEKLKSDLQRSLKQEKESSSSRSVFKSSYNSLSIIFEELSIEDCCSIAIGKYDSCHTVQEKEVHNLNLQLKRAQGRKAPRGADQDEIRISSQVKQLEESYENQLEKLHC